MNRFTFPRVRAVKCCYQQQQSGNAPAGTIPWVTKVFPRAGDRDRAGTAHCAGALCLSQQNQPGNPGRTQNRADVGSAQVPEGLQLAGSVLEEVCVMQGSPRTRTHQVSSGDLAGARDPGMFRG